MELELTVDIMDETGSLKENHIQLVENLIYFIGEKESIENGAEVSISFVTNDEIQVLNKEFRDKDMPTDVLSFAMEEMGEDEIEIFAEGMPTMLGDIVISVDKINEQATDLGHSFERELGFLVTHGMLHLLGFDHMEPEDEKMMFEKQQILLDAFGLKR
ncbi:MAG: rRNA maturation RNase YbeY [Bacillales bacterium]|jgi:probable rRNA maturation factor|nr:rRNA maturation RNase YbeY [Bacillales bacterium]